MKRAQGQFVDGLKRTKTKSQRRRWLGENRQIYEEDTQHGELEKYNRRGKHEGSVDPETGEITKGPVKVVPSRCNLMTMMDLIKLGIVATHAQAEKMAADLIDCWHNDQIPGELQDILGLTPREYQAWTTGGVSLLTIARWQQTSHPALDPSKPWFKLSGRPGRETVGYLKDKNGLRKKLQRKQIAKLRSEPIIVSRVDRR